MNCIVVVNYVDRSRKKSLDRESSKRRLELPVKKESEEQVEDYNDTGY